MSEHADEITGNYSAFADDPRLQVVLVKLSERQKQQEQDIAEAKAARVADEAEWRKRTHDLALAIQKLTALVDVHAAEDNGQHEHHTGAVASLEKRLDRAEAHAESAKSSRTTMWAAIIGAAVTVLIACAGAYMTLDGKAGDAKGRADALQRELDVDRANTNTRLDKIDDRLQAIGDRLGARPSSVSAPNP